MYCTKCGEEVLASPGKTVNFCPVCGEKLEKRPGDQVDSKKSGDAIKANTYVIPEKFTDKFINNQISSLYKSIEGCNSSLAYFSNQVQSALYDDMRIKTEQNQAMQRAHERGERFANSLENEMYKDRLSSVRSEKNKAEWGISDCHRQKAEYEAKKHELESLLHCIPIERVENHYQQLLESKAVAKSAEEFNALANQFQEISDYKDSSIQAEECKKQASRVQYDNLLAALGQAKKEEEFQELARKFHKMNGYENAEELSSQCKNSAIKIRYDKLIEKKRTASSEEDYQELAKQFRNMNGYENTKELAKECAEQYRSLRVQREEKEAVEKEQRSMQEKKEREEREQREAASRELRCKEEKRKERLKMFRYFGKALAMVVEIGALICPFLAGFSIAIPYSIILAILFCLIWFTGKRKGLVSMIVILLWSIYLFVNISSNASTYGYADILMLAHLIGIPVAAVLAFVFK